jgi:hypothetical protein
MDISLQWFHKKNHEKEREIIINEKKNKKPKYYFGFLFL